MLDDLTKEIKAQLYERVKSPLFGAFALSWVVWNYRVLVALVSDLKFAEKMEFIDKAYPSALELSLHGALGPLVSAILFLWLYPYPARWMYSYWATQQKELKKVQQRIEDETPLTQEEANALRKAGLLQVREFQAQLKELAATNKELEERAKLLQEEIARLTTERNQFGDAAKKAQEEATPFLASVLAINPGTDNTVRGDLLKEERGGSNEKIVPLEILSESQRESLRQALGNRPEVQCALLALVSLDGDGELKKIAERAGLGKIDTRHGLDWLKEKELVTLNNGHWSLTAGGRATAVRLGLTAVFKNRIGTNVEAV